ncbi:MAG TPA: alpha/beta hydrolase-fold protein [Flavobacterium sp.]|nr:alpha/beta hydrolase-fold protein [Flavobacterium sp.]
MNKVKSTIFKWKGVLLLALLSAQISSCKKVEFDKGLTQEFSIQSTSNGATYKVNVGLPANYDPNGRYSTIYVLDGEADFAYVANKAKEISKQKGVLNAIVVGIGYGNDRSLDYTPTKADEGGGGGKQFMEFIENELIPKMEQEYGVEIARSGRVILGHSFGGLLSAYAFTNYNSVFGNYIILSPSIWYDNEVLLQYEQDSRTANKDQKQLVYMGLGELENSGRMPAPFEAFYQKLKTNYPNMRLEKKLQPDLDHVGSKASNIEAGLEFYFNNR